MTELRRRRGGVALTVLVDVVRDAWHTRNWIVAAVLLLTIAAVIAAFVGHAVLPWAIYPAL